MFLINIHLIIFGFTKVNSSSIFPLHDVFLRPPHMGTLLTKVKATGGTTEGHGVHL